MKLANPPSPPKKTRGGPLSSRGGTITVAAICALVAAVSLLIFLRQYREDLTGSDPVGVLVARSLVPKGTPGEVVASERLYKIVRVPESELKDTAIKDPADLNDRNAGADIYPGHQIVLGDFEDSGGHVGNHLTGFQRAMTVPVDPAHGMIGEIETGDRVDVVVTTENGAGGVSAARIAARDVLVLDVPGKADGNNDDHPATIRVTDEEAATIAAAADGGQVWLVLRPAVKARAHESTDAVADALGSNGSVKAKIDINVQNDR